MNSRDWLIVIVAVSVAVVLLVVVIGIGMIVDNGKDKHCYMPDEPLTVEADILSVESDEGQVMIDTQHRVVRIQGPTDLRTVDGYTILAILKIDVLSIVEIPGCGLFPGKGNMYYGPSGQPGQDVKVRVIGGTNGEVEVVGNKIVTMNILKRDWVPVPLTYPPPPQCTGTEIARFYVGHMEGEVFVTGDLWTVNYCPGIIIEGLE